MRPLGKSASRLPSLRAAPSIQPIRSLNLRFAFFNAISGFTSRNRATFTAAKSKSPASSSIRARASFFPAANRRKNLALLFLNLVEDPFHIRPNQTQSSPPAASIHMLPAPQEATATLPPEPTHPFHAQAFLPPPSPPPSSCSQFLSTSAEVAAFTSPNTCGCLRTIFE